ncbi:MAG: hypothetical protein Q9166_006377 [cf. Caloplaca sp. 2 TL-2023]
MLRTRPTQIRPTIDEYLSPDRRRKIFTTGNLIAQDSAIKTSWPRVDGTWNIEMEMKVVEMANTGKNAMEITTKLFRLYRRPGAWAETYRKKQELKLNGWIEEAGTSDQGSQEPEQATDVAVKESSVAQLADG